MKGNQEVIDILNALLANELAAINQYFLHGEMCEDWGYANLHAVIEARSIQEMKHAEMLMGRILFLEGRPVVSKLDPIHIGDSVVKQLDNDKDAELEAVTMYNEAVALTTRVGDNGTKVLLESILSDEEEHLDWIEAQLDQIDQMGIQNYLADQVFEE
jgi:bacterioferritin